MPASCIVYTPDRTYLLPSLVSAIQARRHAPPSIADVAIFAFGIDARTEAEFMPICDAENIKFHAVPADALEGAPAMMARLFMNRFVPDHYAYYLYMDGDTQIAGSLEPLLQVPLPAGYFMAANDPMTFLDPNDRAHGARFFRHITRIGLSPRQASFYFNTGVLFINRQGWDDIGMDAWQLVRQRAHIFRFPDQDPLNIIGADVHIPMSLGWNFPIFMRNARVEFAIDPSVYHFMSNPKPWQGSFKPWGKAAGKPYRDTVRRYPSLRQHLLHLSVGKRLRYHVQQRYKQAIEGLTWGYGARRSRILDYEASIALVRT